MRQIFGSIALIAALGSASAALSQQQQQQSQSDQLQSQYYIHEPAPARINPQRAYAKGVQAFQARRYKSAIHYLAKATDVAPDNPDAWRVLGAAYAGEQRWVDSRRAYKRALYLAPNEIVSHAGLGLALKALNDPRAQKQAEWLRARSEACAKTCPEAAVLEALEARGPFGSAPS